MLADVMPSDEFYQQANHYRKRNAKNTAIGIGMYIIGAAFLIGLGGFGEILGNQLAFGVLGLLMLLVISAVATGIIVYSNMSTPLEYKDYNKDTKEEFQYMDSRDRKLFNNIVNIYWVIITVIYLTISFITMLWGITWIIWVVASVPYLIIKMIFDAKYDNNKSDS